MRRSQADVLAIAAVALVSCSVALAGAPAAVAALPGIALFAACGYAWGQVLLGTRVSALERVVVATGLALAVPVLGGLALDAAGIPLHRAAWAGLLTGVTLAGDGALLMRRRAGRAAPFRWPPRGRRLPARHLAAFAAAIVIAAGGVGLARAGAAMQHHPGYAQLWLAARDGNGSADDLGVTSHERGTTRYLLVLERNGRLASSWSFTLADGQTWHRPVPVTGSRLIRADLYKLPDLSHPYRYVTGGSDTTTGRTRP